MKDEDKTNEQLVRELAALRRRVAKLETAETERKQAEEERMRLATVVEQATETIVITDLDGNIVYANPYFEVTTGYAVAEALGKNPQMLKSGRQDAAFYQKLWDTITAGNTWTDTFVNKRKDGSLYNEAATIFPVRGPTGEIINYAAVKRDITEQRRAEEALRESEARYRMLFEQADDAIFVNKIDTDEIVDVNRRACELMGYTREELLVMKAPDLQAPEVRGQEGNAVASELERYGGRPFETLNIHRDGTRIPIEVSTTRMTGTGSDLALCIVRDITARRRAEEERECLLTQIQEQAQRVQLIIDTVPEGVLLLGVDGQVVLANPAAEKALSVLADAKEGDILTHLGDSPLAELLTPPPEGLWHNVTSIGWSYEVIAHSLEAGYNLDGWVLVMRDVTQEREIQWRAQQQERMAAVGQLTAGIAHDFNNFLTAINGFAELMRIELRPDDPLQELVEKILNPGQRAASLVRQLLAFCSKQVIQPQVLNLNDVVADVESMLRRIIGEDIELEIFLEPDLWLVKADQTQIVQVIVNLVVNARDAMPGGGRLTIRTANVGWDPLRRHPLGTDREGHTANRLEVEPDEYVRLAVSDTGVGINEEVQSHIFEPFFTTKERGKGTGLGLATVYGIVKQSGGHIWVYSEQGQGATFRIYLPRISEAVQPSSYSGLGEEMSSGGETILVVEDDADVRDLAQRVLQRQGYTLLEAGDGEEALRLAARLPGSVHLLLTDVIMPGMNGVALAENLARTQPGLKTLFMSGYLDDTVAHHGVLEDDVTFLRKPFTPKTLARKVRAVLDG